VVLELLSRTGGIGVRLSDAGLAPAGTHMPLQRAPDELGSSAVSGATLGGELPIHGRPPGDVVAVWLFASSNFSRSSVRAVVTDITLTTAGETISVL
jgi:hypothetical protein